MLLPEDYVVWDKDLSYEDHKILGLEIASMGEFSQTKIDTLPILVVTPHAFSCFKEENSLNIKLKHLLGSVNSQRHDSVSQVASYLRSLIKKTDIPEKVFRQFHKKFEAFRLNKVTLKAYYFHKNKIVKIVQNEGIEGDAAVIDKVRDFWADVFSFDNLSSYKMHHENFNDFGVVISISPEYDFEMQGHVKLDSRGEFHLEAHSFVKFVYNKHSKKITGAKVLENGHKDSLSVEQVKKLIDIAKILEKTFYLPQVAYWGKLKNEFLVTKILPLSEEINYKDTFNSLTETLTVHPGITIGRLRVVDGKQKTELVLSDEIVLLKKLDKKMIQTIKKAKGIILHEEPDPEIAESLKKMGIPTLVRKHDTLLYSTGDVVSLNAATGEVKKGSMLVS